MIWKERPPVQEPDFGTTIVKKRFALIPIKIHDEWVWLEMYRMTKTYTHVRVSNFAGAYYVRRWIKTREIIR